MQLEPAAPHKWNNMMSERPDLICALQNNKKRFVYTAGASGGKAVKNLLD